MTAAPAIKGWCPTLLSPMESGDGWLARVKPSAGCVSAEAARLIADAARRHGNGHIDLTSRANLQVRGLSPRSAQAFAETIIGAGLASANPSLESIRNVMAAPLGPDDPSASFDSHAVARDVEAALLRREGRLGQRLRLCEMTGPRNAMLADAGVDSQAWWQGQLHAYHWAIQVARNV